MNCRKCQTPLANDSKVCHICGTPVDNSNDFNNMGNISSNNNYNVMPDKMNSLELETINNNSKNEQSMSMPINDINMYENMNSIPLNGYNLGEEEPSKKEEEKQKKKKVSIPYIVILILSIIIVVLLIVIFILNSNMKSNKQNISSSKITLNDFMIEIDEKYNYSYDDNSDQDRYIDLSKNNESWKIKFAIKKGRYQTLKDSSEMIISTAPKNGITITSFKEEEIDGVKYLIFYYKSDNEEGIMSYASIDENYVIAITATDEKSIDKNILENISPIIKSAKFPEGKS